MADPTAPEIPADAPQDVKDFFECKGDKLVWKKGKVTWLTIKVTDDVEVTPEVTFEHGKGDAIDISISLPNTGISGTVTASVNADGQLVIDNVSLLLKPFKGKIDDAVKQINDWFKHNHKKLKPAVLKKGEVTLEKTATTGAYVPPVVPLDEEENQNQPQNVGLTPPTQEWDAAVVQAAEPTQADSTSGPLAGISALLLLLFLGVIGAGLVLGYGFFGGAPAQSSTSPSLVAAGPTLAPTPSPTQAASVQPSQSPAATAAPPSVTVATSPPPVSIVIESACAIVVHQAIAKFVSQIDFVMLVSGVSAQSFILKMSGTNDDMPAVLTYDPTSSTWDFTLGLHEPGPKQILSLVAVLPDGSNLDLTQELLDYFGTDTLLVRYPQADTFGLCPPAPTP